MLPFMCHMNVSRHSFCTQNGSRSRILCSFLLVSYKKDATYLLYTGILWQNLLLFIPLFFLSIIHLPLQSSLDNSKKKDVLKIFKPQITSFSHSAHYKRTNYKIVLLACARISQRKVPHIPQGMGVSAERLSQESLRPCLV